MHVGQLPLHLLHLRQVDTPHCLLLDRPPAVCDSGRSTRLLSLSLSIDTSWLSPMWDVAVAGIVACETSKFWFSCSCILRSAALITTQAGNVCSDSPSLTGTALTNWSRLLTTYESGFTLPLAKSLPRIRDMPLTGNVGLTPTMTGPDTNSHWR